MGKKALNKLRDRVVRGGGKDRGRASSAACATDLAERASEDHIDGGTSRRSSLGSLTTAPVIWQSPHQTQQQQQCSAPAGPAPDAARHQVMPRWQVLVPLRPGMLPVLAPCVCLCQAPEPRHVLESHEGLLSQLA